MNCSFFQISKNILFVKKCCECFCSFFSRLFKKCSGIKKIVPIFNSCSQNAKNVHVFIFSGVSKNIAVHKLFASFKKVPGFKFCLGISKHVRASKFCFGIWKNVPVPRNLHDFQKSSCFWKTVFRKIVQKFGKSLCFVEHSVFWLKMFGTSNFVNYFKIRSWFQN